MQSSWKIPGIEQLPYANSRARGLMGGHRQFRARRRSFAGSRITVVAWHIMHQAAFHILNSHGHSRLRPVARNPFESSTTSSTNDTTVQPTFTAHRMAEPSVQNQSQPRRAARPNHNRRRPHGRGGKGGAKSTPVSTHAASSSSAPNASAPIESGENEKDDSAVQTQIDPQQDESQEQDLCWICAEPIKYYAVSECNHRTCHVCALRLRALYKKLDCTFCKVRVASTFIVDF